MRTILKILVLLGVFSYLIFAMVTFARPQEEGLCSKVDFIIEASDSSATRPFMNREYARQILKKNMLEPVGKKLADLDLIAIQHTFQKDAYIDSAYCYYTPTGILCVGLLAKQPVMRVSSANGKNYYMDAKGDAMPAHSFNLDLPVLSGEVDLSDAKELTPLASYIAHDDYWKMQIEQIYLHEGEINLILREGNFVVEMGNAKDFEKKLNRLHQFITDGLPKVGWDRYSVINVSYNNQIVCQR